MSLTVETGAGLAGAEAYASVGDADARLAGLGMTNWATLQTAEKEQALRRATQFMEQSWRSRWLGLRRHVEQALSWPRWDVMVDGSPVDPDSVPAEVRNACIDLAFKAAAGDLNADLARGIVREKVGPVETEYDRFSPQSVRYPSIEQMLAPFLTGGRSSVRLARA